MCAPSCTRTARSWQRQQQGLRYDPPLTLIDDADTQARWYYRLKREYRRARAEGRPLREPGRAAHPQMAQLGAP